MSVFARLVKYSVCPLNWNSSFWILLLFLYWKDYFKLKERESWKAYLQFRCLHNLTVGNCFPQNCRANMIIVSVARSWLSIPPVITKYTCMCARTAVTSVTIKFGQTQVRSIPPEAFPSTLSWVQFSQGLPHIVWCKLLTKQFWFLTPSAKSNKGKH